MNLAILADSWTQAWGIELNSSIKDAVIGENNFPLLASIFKTFDFNLTLYTVAGGSNRKIINNVLENDTAFNTPVLDYYDFVIFLQTDPFRDLGELLPGYTRQQ